MAFTLKKPKLKMIGKKPHIEGYKTDNPFRKLRVK